MNARYEELDWSSTAMGEIVLRRRREPVVDRDIFEVKLGDEFLMSSLFTVAEIELARLGLSVLDGASLSVLVGGLGLGYTAQAALADDRVASMVVVEAIEPVIEWHRRRLLPETAGLADDSRCDLVHDDFFERLDRSEPDSQLYDAVLLDIDHSPRHVLSPDHAEFYTPAGLRRLSNALKPNGVFALWSDDPPDAAFEEVLGAVFDECESHVVAFANPLTGGESANTVYLGRHRTPA
ncbi:MAG: spermidine synthase [Actinomycetia bacterium]|nr:spermidine synthase [Actinomycetes bacterium]